MVTKHTQKQEALRSHIWDVMHYCKGNVGHVFSYVMIVLILMSVAILPMEFLPELHEYTELLIVMEIVLTILFTLEYLLRIYATPNRFQYIFSFFGIIDLMSILPFYLGFLGTQYVRVFRLARLIRVLKISRLEAAASVEKETAKEVGLIPGEHVEHVVSHHPIFFLLGLIPATIAISIALAVLLVFPMHPAGISFAVTFFLIAFIFLYKAFLDYNFDVIYVTTHRLILQNRHLVGRNTNQVNYRSITNVKPQYNGILSYVLGFGSIVIETPAEISGHIEHHFVRKHEDSAQYIISKCFNAPQQ